jgi:hypothetical protein
LLGSGLAAMGAAVAVAVAAAVKGNLDGAAPGIAFLTVIALGMFASGALRLPAWSRLRARQMEALGEEAATPADTPRG